jgi:hypothetical protein
MTETQKALIKFRDTIINEAKANLKSMGKDSTGKLSKSIKGQVKEMPNSISMYFQMEAYGYFQDKGVSGIKKKYNTPFSYTTKMPPPSKLDKWIVRKGIAPRDKKGKLMSRKGLQFAIARGIFINGIKPSLFFTKPFEKAFKKLPDVLVDKYGLDAEQLFDSIMKETLTKK